MRLAGRWRIVELEAFDDDYLDLVKAAYIELDERGLGEMAFGALTAALDCAYTPSGFDFTWDGSDEGDQVTGDGWAELQPDGSLLGEISWRNGDETEFKALPWTNSSTAC
ncbi:MAG: hypothetical protein P4M09_11420 [Devosia sp.]|nr:hypothetical protein [Devosia sp.]